MQIEVTGNLAVLALDRPAVLNAIDDRVCIDLMRALDRLENDEAVSVLVLTGGTSRAFSAGADLKFMRGLPADRLRRFIELTWLAFDRIARSPLVSVAAIHGYALGGGAELALACDLRLAEEDAALGFPEMTLGSVPGSGAMQRLPDLIGRSAALDLVTSGRRVSGTEALALGLVTRTTPTGTAVTAGCAWGHTLAQLPADALRYAKLALRVDTDPTIAPAMHGMISAVCQKAAGYRSNTERFAGEGA